MSTEKGKTNNSVPMILILGETGVGKSTLINAAGPVGKTARVGHSLESCTETPENYWIVDDKRRVILVDTPGFNDTNTARHDGEILKIIILWLQKMLNSDNNAMLAGIIYLYDITNVEGRLPKLVDINKFQRPPSIVLATVQCHNGEITDQRKSELKARYPDVFTGDHFGDRNQKTSALALIDKVLDARAPAPLSTVIDKLQRLSDGRATVKSKFFVWKIIRKLFSSFKE